MICNRLRMKFLLWLAAALLLSGCVCECKEGLAQKHVHVRSASEHQAKVAGIAPEKRGDQSPLPSHKIASSMCKDAGMQPLNYLHGSLDRIKAICRDKSGTTVSLWSTKTYPPRTGWAGANL